ncbi:MAG TPA: 30S ribosomal protein S17 [Verrucomicrobiae bacterium]|nr:30S ribosomal protein S17 [Verrucomicrobiae bacterium]
MAETATNESKRQELVGEVVGDKMTKTIVVEVARRVRHPRYQKVMTTYKKFYAHDEKREAGVGDTVRIIASRPLSKLKRWRLVSVLEKAAKIEKADV